MIQQARETVVLVIMAIIGSLLVIYASLSLLSTALDAVNYCEGSISEAPANCAGREF